MQVVVQAFLGGVLGLHCHKEGIRLKDSPVSLQFFRNLKIEGLTLLSGIERVQDVHLAHAHSLEQDGGRHLAAAVYADIEDILMVEVKIEP